MAKGVVSRRRGQASAQRERVPHRGGRYGLFITFEGPEGSGKSTQAKKLARWLSRSGRKVVFVQDPGSTRLGRRLRDVLLCDRTLRFSPIAEGMLFIAARAQLVVEKIMPALEKNAIVVCDRFHDSTVAYQGYGGEGPKEWLDQVGLVAIGKTMPDLTFLLDLPIKVAFKRLDRAKDRMENKNIRFHERVRQGYLEMAKKQPERFIVLDGMTTANELSQAVCSVVWKRLNLHVNELAAD